MCRTAVHNKIYWKLRDHIERHPKIWKLYHCVIISDISISVRNIFMKMLAISFNLTLYQLSFSGLQRAFEWNTSNAILGETFENRINSMWFDTYYTL